MRNVLFAIFFSLAAKSSAQPCQAAGPFEVVAGVECNLYSDGFNTYQPCGAPLWVIYAPVGAILFLNYQLENCVSFCLQGPEIHIFCAESAGVTDSLCAGDSTVIGSPPQANYTYQWTPVFSLSCSNCAQPIASPAFSQVYLRTATDTLCPACPPVKEQYLLIVDSCLTGVSDLQNLVPLRLFPQPTTGVLYYAGAQPEFFEIFDARGVWIKKMIHSGIGSLDISELPNGIYFIRAFGNKQAVTCTIIKSAP